jgi:hypothetical protein
MYFKEINLHLNGVSRDESRRPQTDRKSPPNPCLFRTDGQPRQLGCFSFSTRTNLN